jgi:tetratricopeptide (TPR) repeat protein
MRRNWTICLLLVALTLAVYWRTSSYSFISYDDPDYVSANKHVQRGLTIDNIRWAFTTGAAANWHPITWLSHMLDWQLFGNRPGMHHLMNVLLHAANAVLVYWVLTRMTGAIWKSAIVAALFALHPLHVQSVAWVAERKDVLSTFFMLLTLLAYERYVKSSKWQWYAAVIVLFALALMAKPMAITLPLIFLLLDWWPLERRDVKRAILEKIPLLALAAASAIVTFLVQRAGGAVTSVDKVPAGLRISNAIVSYARYLLKMVWPVDLAVFYPMPKGWPVWEVAFAALFLIAVTSLVLRSRKRMPWLAVGWLWYLIMLLPVIGIIQVGEQAMADRYTYLPLLGIFIMIVWSVPEKMHRAATAGAALALVVLSALTAWQVGYWQNSETLFCRAANVTSDNWLAYNHLASALAEQQRYPEALSVARTAVSIHPSDKTHFNLANLLRKMGDLEGATLEYQRALDANPNLAVARNNLGITLAQLGRLPEAEHQLRAAISIDNNYADAHANLGLVLRDQGKIPEAKAQFEAALQLDPNQSIAKRGLESLKPTAPLP